MDLQFFRLDPLGIMSSVIVLGRTASGKIDLAFTFVPTALSIFQL